MPEEAMEQATSDIVPEKVVAPVDDRTSVPSEPPAPASGNGAEAAGEKPTARLEAIRKRRSALQAELEQVRAKEAAAVAAVQKRRRQRAQRGRTVLGALVLTLVRARQPGAEELVRAAIGQARDAADRAVVTEVLDGALGKRQQI